MPSNSIKYPASMDWVKSASILRLHKQLWTPIGHGLLSGRSAHTAKKPELCFQSKRFYWSDWKCGKFISLSLFNDWMNATHHWQPAQVIKVFNFLQTANTNNWSKRGQSEILYVLSKTWTRYGEEDNWENSGQVRALVPWSLGHNARALPRV